MYLNHPISVIPQKIASLLENHAQDIEEAWANCGDDPLSISFSAKIDTSHGKNVCDVSISFTKEKVKDSLAFEWNPNQPSLFKEKKEGG